MRRGRGSAVQGGAQTVVVLLEGRVVRLEFEDPGDSGDIDSGAHQFDDPLDDLEIVVAVAARPTRCACGVQQPRRSYRRKVCGSSPDSSAATEMP